MAFLFVLILSLHEFFPLLQHLQCDHQFHLQKIFNPVNMTCFHPISDFVFLRTVFCFPYWLINRSVLLLFILFSKFSSLFRQMLYMVFVLKISTSKAPSKISITVLSVFKLYWTSTDVRRSIFNASHTFFHLSHQQVHIKQVFFIAKIFYFEFPWIGFRNTTSCKCNVFLLGLLIASSFIPPV